ncbi:hypothetical protein [Sinomicrobium oceani]|uniref:hypothetical protein n=1 Tax=Sinomicrobium oceani TaxID=1150368 RepID=UPI00227B96A9|nr:hypothetical protein [Sinomicrobium oceani]
MNKITKIGGVRIGIMNATWPFARLIVDSRELKLITIMGKYVFRKEDIIEIKNVTYIPIIAQGIKIEHKIPRYNKLIIFWILSNPQKFMEGIKQKGFMVR